MRRRFALAAALFVAILATAGVARADERADFEKARNAYLKKDYQDADTRFRAMLDPATGTLHSPDVIIEAQMCWGAVDIALGKKKEATGLFEKVIRKNPQYQPDPLTYPTDVLNTFTDEQSKLRGVLQHQAEEKARQEAAKRAAEAAEKARQAEQLRKLRELASTEAYTDHHSRWIAMLPFGVGQFQNGKPVLGGLFFGSEAAMIVASGVLFVSYRLSVDSAYGALADDSTTSANYKTQVYNFYAHRAGDIRTADLVVLGALAATMIAGVVEAQWHYVPDIHGTRRRELPPDLLGAPTNPGDADKHGSAAAGAWIMPTVTPLVGAGDRGGHAESGVVFGVLGAF